MPPVPPPPVRATPRSTSSAARTDASTTPRPVRGPGTTPTVAVGAANRPPSVVSATSAARFAERARARRSIARRHAVMLAVATVVVLGLGYVLFFSPVLALDAATVKVEGAGTVVAVDQVRAAVDMHDGTPLPRLDTGGLQADVLDVPGVREATVTREWPHGLTVTLVSREPVAAVPAQGRTGYSLLDEEGVQVGHVRKAPAELPVVDVPVGDKRTLRAVLSVVEQLPAELLADVGSVSARTQDTVSMQLRGSARVDWGSAAETPLKVAVLTTLLATSAGARADLIDVSAPRMPITK